MANEKDNKKSFVPGEDDVDEEDEIGLEDDEVADAEANTDDSSTDDNGEAQE